MSMVLVGSTNQVKGRAVGRGIDGRPDLPFWSRDKIIPAPAESGVKPQPSSLEEIVQGAKNRARWCREHRQELLSSHLLLDESDDLDLFVGLESGTLFLDATGTTMELCAAYLEMEGAASLGFSSAFAVPHAVAGRLTTDRMANGYTLDDACLDAGLTKSSRLGGSVGLVGLLSKGVLTREDYTFEAFRNAMFGLVFEEEVVHRSVGRRS